MDFPFFQVADGGLLPLFVQKIAAVDLHQQSPFQHPVYQAVVPQHSHIPVHMGDHRLSVKILPQADDFIQHIIRPGSHRRLNQNGSPGNGQLRHLPRLADARKVQHLRSGDNPGIYLGAAKHGLLKGLKPPISAQEKGPGILPVGVKMRGAHHSVHSLLKAQAQHFQALPEAFGPIVHFGQHMAMEINHG